MILATNIGNTNIRVALGCPNLFKQAVFYAHEDDFIGQIEARLFSGDKMMWDKITDNIIATVVPEQTDMVISALYQKTQKPVKRIDIRNCGNLRTNQYEGLLGEDRVVCCARALQKYQPPFAVIDFGTATTINIVNKNGEFLGGAILPGLLTGLNALNRKTAQLPLIERIERMDESIPLIGKNTIENLVSGAVIGMACATQGFISRVEEELACKLNIVVTGGHTEKILPHCHFDYIHEPTLLLEGLLGLV